MIGGLIGRDADVRRVTECVSRSPLVTVLGPPGIGIATGLSIMTSSVSNLDACAGIGGFVEWIASSPFASSAQSPKLQLATIRS